MGVILPNRRLLDWLEKPSGYWDFLDDRSNWHRHQLEDLAACASANAALLRASGLRRNDRVALVHRTGPAFAVSFFATLAAGGTPSPVTPPPAMGDIEQWTGTAARVLRAAEARFVITDSDLVDHVRTAAAGVTEVVQADLSARGDFRPERPADLALVQFTSGSRGTPRGVRVSWENLTAQLEMAYRWLGRPGTFGTSWLPLYHDMGLVGCFLLPLVHQLEHALMRPEQFIQSPLAWLRRYSHGGGEVIAMPNFGYDYVARRISPADLEGMDFSAVRAVVSGAERVLRSSLEAFHNLLEPHGLAWESLQPAYGLAEGTLAVTGVPFGRAPIAVAVPPGSDRQGVDVLIADQAEAPRWHQRSERPGVVWHVGCGVPMDGTTVDIVDDRGLVQPERRIGEIRVAGPAVAQGYTHDVESASTRFDGEYLLTGDAGFKHDGELFVLGRIGDSIQVRGRNVYVEDVETAVRSVPLLSWNRVVALAGMLDGAPMICLLTVTDIPVEVLDTVLAKVGEAAGSGVRVVVVRVPRSAFERTSSGKPRRASMWRRFVAGELAGAVILHDTSDC